MKVYTKIGDQGKTQFFYCYNPCWLVQICFLFLLIHFRGTGFVKQNFRDHNSHMEHIHFDRTMI